MEKHNANMKINESMEQKEIMKKAKQLNGDFNKIGIATQFSVVSDEVGKHKNVITMSIPKTGFTMAMIITDMDNPNLFALLKDSIFKYLTTHIELVGKEMKLCKKVFNNIKNPAGLILPS